MRLAKRWGALLGMAVLATAASAETKTASFAVPAALTYKDARWNCAAQTMIGNEVFVVATLEDGKLVSATLRIGSATTAIRTFLFEAAELAGQKIALGADGRFWFSELVLSERLLREAFYFWTYLACGAPRVRTIENAPLTFEFPQTPPPEGERLKSNEIKFRGNGGSGRAYDATLTLGQGTL